MRIVIDLQGAQSESRFRGIGRYSLSLALAIARNATEHEVWVALNGRMQDSIPDIRAAFSSLIPKERVRVFDVPWDLNPSPWTARASEVIREEFFNSLEPDIVLISSMFEGPWAGAVTSIGATTKRHKTAVILYDLIPLLNKDVYLPTAELQDYYFRKIDSLKKADVLLAISESSSDEAVEHLGFPKDNVSNISAAIDARFYRRSFSSDESVSLLHRLGIQDEFILFAPGGFDPRKNFSRLFEAYSSLKGELRGRYQLVIASKLHEQQRIELMEFAEKFGVRGSEFVLTGYVEDEDLIALYSLASVFVFPSTHEGFGLPVLEAMACGAPVIGSNCSSVPEVIGLDEALFDPFSVVDMSKKITEVLENKAFRERLVAHALKQSAKFSWDESARSAIAAIEATHNLTGLRQYQYSQSEFLGTLARLQECMPSEGELVQVSKSIAFNFSGRAVRQLLLDVSSIVHSDAKSGIQRVVRSLLQEFLHSPPESVTVRPIYYNAGNYYYANKFVAKLFSFQGDSHDELIDYAQGDVYLSLDLNMHLADELYPLHTQMQSLGVEVNFIVYDLLLVHRPDWWHAPNPEFFQNWLNRITSVATGLVCISRAVADELSAWMTTNLSGRLLNIPEVKSFHLGADFTNSVPSNGLPETANKILASLTERPSFLMVSTIEPRKGHAQALAAFELLWAKGRDCNLVIVGKRGWLVDSLVSTLEHHPELNSRLFWLEGVSDEYLEKVYDACTCLIAASEGEGFGLPLIEAAQHHLPIVARDIPVFREVAGEHAFYFKGLTPADLAVSIEQWADLFDAGAHPASVQMPWLTWRQSAKQLEHVIFQ